MIVIMLMILIIAWLLSCLICGIVGFFIGRENIYTKRKKRTVQKAEPTEMETYLKDKKKREEENFWNYDGTEQDIK
ncbi:MAG: hypothetical protein IKK13_06625 [Clostridia bacterium]|nr:hypothetical protein [Clostridia bacterium]